LFDHGNDSYYDLARQSEHFPTIPFNCMCLRDPQLNQGIDLFPEQHHAPAETSDMREILSTTFSLAQSVWV